MWEVYWSGYFRRPTIFIAISSHGNEGKMGAGGEDPFFNLRKSPLLV